ncbi:penicillin-binding transpeptidase domain-containing protein [Vagococcus xieshaowenii]|uniref:Penicillin-binding protein 2 n=1 Tax=Vagococcus xieshaowenii TaxID=2562451 RepID=A0AAJ5EHF5_9ENTE|nr:penicillin-binding transpeptidase domain-containing protein [Vagococcus xieshaowenii]QCA28992.1 penicillin-binding protein 2 [Vagococcus xieshaowenii]TFZ43173.1 penicillin-binding protein 2 [Vagococcus xieshaowenii]
MWEKWQNFIQRKGLNPIVNRKKFSIFLFFVTIGVFLLFIARFSYVVLIGRVGNTSLSDKTQELYQGSSVIKAKRGTIYDRNGNIIAADATSYSLYAVLDNTYLGIATNGKNGSREKLYVEDKNKEKVAEVIAKNTDLEKEYVLDQLNQDLKQVEFGNGGKNLTLETKNKIEESLDADGIKGIYFTEQQARVYPNGIFASHLIGYAQNDGEDSMTGQMGIEKAENETLSGKNGKETYLKDSAQRKIAGSVEVEKKAVDGKDIYTTLDLNLQVLLEDSMTEVLKKFPDQDDMTAMLVEAKTGNIVAASQRPTFNPETKEGLEKQDDETDIWSNLLIQRQYEPGSTMKVFTVATAFENGILDPNAYVKTGVYEFEDGTKIYDWNKEGEGTITYRQAFAFSSNVAMVNLETQMKDKWVESLDKFGFNKLTGTNLLNEVPGYLPDMSNSVDSAITSYGQGISVTPFQMIQAYTAIANNGTMLKPNYISKVVDSNGEIKEMPVKEVGKPISAETAKKTLDMMTSVVEDQTYGTGTSYGIDGYRVSAKTGTAQVFDNSTGKYFEKIYINSAVQIAPTENPEYIMFVTTKGDGEQASTIISSVSNKVLKEALDRKLK